MTKDNAHIDDIEKVNDEHSSINNIEGLSSVIIESQRLDNVQYFDITLPFKWDTTYDIRHVDIKIKKTHLCDNNELLHDITLSFDDVFAKSFRPYAFYGISSEFNLSRQKTIRNIKSYYGFEATHKLITGSYLNSRSYYGVDTKHTITKVKQFNTNAYYGIDIDLSITKVKQFNQSASYGNSAIGYVTTPQRVRPNAYFGIRAEFDLWTELAPTTDAHFGISASYKFYKYKSLSTDSYFGIINEYRFQRPLWSFKPKAYFGSYASNDHHKLALEFLEKFKCFHDVPYNNTSMDLDLEEQIFDHNIVSPEAWMRIEYKLSRRPYFLPISAYYGASMVEAPKPKFKASNYFGSFADTYRMNMYNPIAHLCDGNNTLAGTNVMIDFNVPDRHCFRGTGGYYGASIDYDLTPKQSRTFKGYYGCEAKYQFKIDKKFKPYAYYGSYIWFGLTTDTKLKPIAGYGTAVRSSIRPREYQAYYGFESFYKLSMLYKLEFLEDGCLSNEYIPVDENGNVDVITKKSQAIEGYTYQHTIKRRVYY